MSERITVHLDGISDELMSQLVGRCAVANGCFDVLHPGHLSLLAHLDTVAYRMGLRPVVAVNSDESVRRLKGVGRPVNTLTSRAILLNHLKWPFTVVIFDEDTPRRLMDTLRPKIVMKGSEYSYDSVVKNDEAQVMTVPMIDGWSTSGILRGDTR